MFWAETGFNVFCQECLILSVFLTTRIHLWLSRSGGAVQRSVMKTGQGRSPRRVKTEKKNVLQCVLLADLTAKAKTRFIMQMYSHCIGLYAQQSTHTCIGSCCNRLVLLWLRRHPQRRRGERGARQRENTEEDELDLYDVLVRRGWGHVGTYESIMNLDYACLCMCMCVCVSIAEV